MSKILILLFFMVSFSVNANPLRNLSMKFLGEDLTGRLFGVESKQEVTMPEIPNIEKDATATKSIEKKYSQDKISADELNKYNYVYISELYLETKNRKANDDEISKWMNALDQGATREGIYRAMVLDRVYLGFENFDSVSSEKVSEFGRWYFKKFLNKQISEKQLAAVNYYTLKRIAVENSLEVIDQFDTAEKVYSWYGVLSSDLAKRFPDLWKNKLRKDNSASKHLVWARSVPEQLIKSEVIIKLHKAFNHLAKE